MTLRAPFLIVLWLLAAGAAAPAARAAERLCDPSVEDCRAPLLDLIRNETQGIDLAFWFMEDVRYSRALVDAHQRGVPVRVLIDTKANTPYPGNIPVLRELEEGGVPMRRITSSWLHWKFMLFAGQNVVQFGSANHTPHAFVYVDPLRDFIDETIFFSDDPKIVNSFMRKFDDAWVNTSRFADYANVTGPLTRSYPLHSTSSALNFPPSQSFATRSVARYDAETEGIDIIMFRMGDGRHADAIIAARRRGIPVRLYVEQAQYRDPKRPWSAYDFDRLYAAGVQMRQRRHLGWNHQKLTLLRGQNMAIFGSQNWTHTSGQYEHNYFTTKPWLYQALSDQFLRKWNSSTETEPFVPERPSTPRYVAPASAAQVTTADATLQWDAGLWAHQYDVYFGSAADPPLVAANLPLGFSASSSDLKSYTVAGLAQNTTYYWRVVSRNMAGLERSGPIWSFRTGGAATLPASWQSTDIGPVGIPGSASENGGSFTVNGAGADVWGTSDGFHYAYQALTGDGTITARVASLSGSHAWTKVGVMMRASTAAGAAHGFMFVSRAKGLAFQRRTAAGASTTHTSGGGGSAPRWVRLVRAGSRITAYVSSNGTNFSSVGSDTFSFPSTVLVGLAVTSHSTSALATGVFDSVSITTSTSGPPPTALPSGWQARDIGSVTPAGSSTHTDGSYTIQGAGADIWGASDAFHFAYRLLSGDGTIIARLASLNGSHRWSKAGVMVRESTDANAAHAFMLVSEGKGVAFQRRTSAGAASAHTGGGGGTAPQWVRLTRAGDSIAAYRSPDGTNWTLVGEDTFASMPSTALVGLAVTSHDDGTLATGVFDNVSVSGGP